MKRACLAWAAALLAAPALAAGGAGLRRDVEFRVNHHTAGAQDDPAVAAADGGRAVVAWESAGQDGNGDGVFVRALAPRERLAGSPWRVVGDLQVNTYTTGQQDDPVLALLGDGTYVVVWESTGQDGSEEGLFARRLSAAGEPTGAEFGITTRTTGNQDAAALAATADGGFVVVWESLGQDGDGEAVMGQRFDAAGGRLGVEFRVNGAARGDQYEPAVAAREGGGFVVAWSSYQVPGADGSGGAVLARRYGADGAPLGPEFLVNTYTTDFQAHPAVAALPGGGFVVAWASYTQDGSGYGIYAQRFDAEGAPAGAEFQVNTTTSGFQLWPSVSAAPSGDFMIVWESGGQDGDGDAVAGRVFAAGGQPLTPEYRINMAGSGAQEDAAVAADPQGGFVVVWESADGSSDGISGRRWGGGVSTSSAGGRAGGP